MRYPVRPGMTEENKNTKNMEKNNRKESYEPPKMEILEIMVEQAIMNASVLDWDDGGDLGGGDAEETTSFGW